MPTQLSEYQTTPVYRHLRGYAIDPGLALQLETAPITEVMFHLPWEALAPGPVGDYLEVIDHDPAGKCFYEPVDLNAPFVLAQNGLAPSEGTPQFHQQMVYAVARLTIHNFERALGRPALWSPRQDVAAGEDRFVRQLRVYPHALREANAYYSPAKKALLFGYFPALGDDPGDHVPGGLVFTCLSHDIVAHETTHALLDGLQHKYNRPTNPDMLAFHEGFADLVALFQHFTFSEILRHQIAQTRGDIRSHETLLGQLAGQFGRATGARSALRDAIGTYNKETKQWTRHEPDPAEYANTLEPHQRGGLLVAAVFDAFLAIYSKRTADLLRLYTGGSGVLPAGAVHPDLVNRLAAEASKAADQVLAMCVRAVDYCPPLDLTFGEYLRAIITADVDLVPDDDLGYRVAFVEAFRRRGLYPLNLRTLSVENLVWRRPDRDEIQPSPALLGIFTGLRQTAYKQFYNRSRQEVCEQSGNSCDQLATDIEQLLHGSDTAAQDAAFLGLETPGAPIEAQSVRFASRTSPDGGLLLQAIVQIIQKSSAASEQAPAASFEGGCTLILNLQTEEIAYCVRKPVTSSTRRVRQDEFASAMNRSGLRATYSDAPRFDESREPFALLHRGEA